MSDFIGLCSCKCSDSNGGVRITDAVLQVCVPVNAATATEQSVVDDTTQQETKKADTQMKEQRTIRVGSLAQ